MINNKGSWLITVVAIIFFIAAMTGCQSEQPQPLDNSEQLQNQKVAASSDVREEMEEAIQWAEDRFEVENLMSHYTYYVFNGDYKSVLDLFALDEVDVRIEQPMWGAFIGKDKVTKFLMAQDKSSPTGLKPGEFWIVPLNTPKIEIAGNGKTAQGMFWSPGAATMLIDGKPKAYWYYPMFGVDFKKVDGEWKIWHFHEYGRLFHPVEKEPGAWHDGADEGGIPNVGGNAAYVEAKRKASDAFVPTREAEDTWVYGGPGKPYEEPRMPVPYEYWIRNQSY